MLPSDVLEDIRKKVEGGLGPLTKGGSDDLAGALFGKAQGAADQLSGFATAIGEWVAFARELIRAEVRDVVERELAVLQPATSKQIEALIARVERLERSAPATPRKKSGGKASAKPPAGGKSKRKAIARNLDDLAVRVERLERSADPAPVKLRVADSAASPPGGGSAKKAGAKPSRSTTTRTKAARAASTRSTTTRAKAPATKARTSGRTAAARTASPDGGSRPATDR